MEMDKLKIAAEKLKIGSPGRTYFYVPIQRKPSVAVEKMDLLLGSI